MRPVIKIIIFLLLPLYSLAEEGFVIKGKVTGIISGYVAILEHVDEAGKPAVLPPRVRIINGEFTFSGKLDHPELIQLKVSTKTVQLFLENTTYTVESSLDSLTGSSFKGGRMNDQFYAYQQYSKPQMEYVKDNPELELSAWLALRNASTADKAEQGYALLAPAGRSTWHGKALLAKIESFKRTGAGAALPELKLTDPDGHAFSIKDMAGKVVVLDFWASWCAPCRAYIPQMRNHYNKFKEKGVVFVAVSVDDDKAKWLTAVNETKMEWLQGLTEGGFKAGIGVQQHFNITSIPHVVIVGKDGKIAQSLDFYKKDQLEKELDKLVQ
ncbi:thioredoxin-like domain-containing protein [Chitinophaga sp. RCC_12]|uniref:thioredoxin-like domain-containing protein n=1 Tax=Chitinophaga sp. RCC_12 TaxID=3239226 RepID=UPI00352473C5